MVRWRTARSESLPYHLDQSQPGPSHARTSSRLSTEEHWQDRHLPSASTLIPDHLLHNPRPPLPRMPPPSRLRAYRNVNTTLTCLINTLSIPKHLNRTHPGLGTLGPQILRDRNRKYFLARWEGFADLRVVRPGPEVGREDFPICRADVDDGDVGVARVRGLDVAGQGDGLAGGIVLDVRPGQHMLTSTNP